MAEAAKKVDNTSVAYDYERFERKPAQKPRMEVVRTNRAERVALDRQRMLMLRTVMLMLIVVVVAAVYLVSKVQVTELTDRVTAAKEELAAAQSENVRLSLLMESQLSMSNIEKWAEELGLSKLQQYQVTCVTLNASDVVIASGYSRGFFGEVWDSVCGLFGGIGAYFGL